MELASSEVVEILDVLFVAPANEVTDATCENTGSLR
jgi:hypothetical protein